MTTLVAVQRIDHGLALRPLLASRWLWCLAAALFVVLRDIGHAQLFTSLGDTDDAVRLVQVREWLATGSWYDMLLPRFGGPTPLLSHWSRLVDLPIGVLLVFFGTFLSAETAELAVRVVWPALLLVVFLRLFVGEAEKRGGTPAAVIALALAVTTMTGLYQFKSGRLDHHNVMILLTLGGFLLMARSFADARIGYGAGLMLGGALVVGYEPLLMIVPAVGVLAIVAVLYTDHLAAARNVAIGLAASAALGMLVTTPPSLWHVAPCDALGANFVLLSTFGALGLVLITAQGRNWPVAVRLGALSCAGVIGISAFFAANPACVRGPFGAMNQEAIDLWLVTVWEGKSVFETMAHQPGPMLVYCIFAGLALFAAVIRLRRHRSADATALLALLVLTTLASLTAIKFVPYGSFFAAFALALTIADFTGSGQLTPLSARLLGALVANQSSLLIAVGLALNAGGASKEAMAGAALKATDQCHTTDVMRALAKLPKGFIVASVDFGPYIVAQTRHDVLAAPYHRIDGAIADSYRILRGTPEAAEQKLRALDADYLIDCVYVPKPGQPLKLEQGVSRDSLIGRLTFGETVPFLAEMKDVTHEPSVRVWRIKRRDE